MRISIIIVNWNVREHLKRCLHSLFVYAPKVDFEVIVIDNASIDTSVEMVRQEFSHVKLVCNTENYGFARGCNQGAHLAKGEYLFFLNPDTEVKENTLSILYDTIRNHPKCGMVAPTILQENGDVLPSIRRFPTPLVMLALFCKMQKFFPKTSLFKWYYAHDIDYSKIQEVEQPQGAALFVRTEVFNELNGFDENFFLWLDEVDLCKRMKEKGYSILLVPEAHIMHVGGKSFHQKPLTERQRIFFQSSLYYLKKHFGFKAWYAIIPLKIYTTLLLHPLFSLTCLGLLTTEVISFFGYSYPLFREGGFIFLSILFLCVSLYRLEYGVMILLSELIIGSKGHLFFVTVGSHEIGIRSAFFICIIFSWIVSVLRSTRSKKEFLNDSFLKSKFFIPFILLGCCIGYGVANGLLHHFSKETLMNDANAWFYFLSIFPVYQALTHRETIYRMISVCTAAVSLLILKSLFVFYILKHPGFGGEFLYTFFRWIRTSGVGEVVDPSRVYNLLDVSAYRIFFQSHFYLLPCVFILVSSFIFFFESKHIKSHFSQGVKFFMLSACVAVLLISFSRSLWVGCVSGGIFFLIAVLIKKISISSFFKTIGIFCGSCVIAFLVLAGILTISYPQASGVLDISLITQRFSQTESAVVSRQRLLPVLLTEFKKNPIWGYGFGKEVTYFSQDPRVIEKNKTGEYTTYAFEWGYLDILVKIGLVGLTIYFFFLFSLFRVGWRAYIQSHGIKDSALLLGLLCGFVGLGVVHMFTPYLNHPLGIGYLIFCAVIFERLKNNS